MKKSKFVLLTLTFILFLGFSLFFGVVEVKAASEHSSDWTAPQAAKSFVDKDGKGVRVYIFSLYTNELGEFDYARVVGVKNYTFEDGTQIGSGVMHTVGSGYFDTSLADLITYYLSKYSSGATILGSDRAYIYFDVNAQRFKLEYHGADYIGFWIEQYASGTSYQEGFNVGYDQGYIEGYDVGHDAGYDEGYQEGMIVKHEAAYYEGYNTGYEVGYDDARPEIDILLITLIMYILSIIIYFKFNLKWVLVGTVLLWFVPIFLVDNIFVKIFSVIMIIATITITFFSGREEEY